MSVIDHLQSELEMFALMVPGFAGSIVRHAELIPDDKWNWSFSERTPTAREICEHAFVWMWCDRQQMTVPDLRRHRPTPNLPADRDSMLRLLEEEVEEWRRLIGSFTPEQLLDEYEAFDGDMRNLRGFLFHIGQHLIYKLGQLSVLYYELGLDGPEPYDAPYPNQIYGFADAALWPAGRNDER